MSQLDFIALALLGASALAAVGSFAVIANYLFDHGLADRRDPVPNLITLYKKYRDHTRAASGRAAPMLWVHLASAGVFILTGTVYVVLKFI